MPKSDNSVANVSSSARPEAVPARARRKQPGRPRSGELQGEGLRELVIAAAAQVYSTHGYRGTSVEMIANAAHISRPLFYRLFKDRADVIDVVVARANEALRTALMGAIAPDACLAQMLTTMMDVYFAWCAEHRGVAGAIYREIHDTQSPASVHRARIVADVTGFIVAKMATTDLPAVPQALIETLVYAVEHVGATTFWPHVPSEAVVRQNRAVVERIVQASLADTTGLAGVPPLATLVAQT